MSPLWAWPHVRREDLPGIESDHRPASRTKPELAVEPPCWAKTSPGPLKGPIRAVADGAHAGAAVLKPAGESGMTVVGRLREGAAPSTVPGARPKGERGRPRIHGAGRIDPAKRAGQPRGWSTGEFESYGAKVVEEYKTFLASWRPAGGTIRVVLVDEPKGSRACLCIPTPRRASGRS